MASTTDVLVDTNVLLRTQFDKTFQMTSATCAMTALLSRGSALYAAVQSFAEFWNVSTRTLSANGFGLSFEETDRRLVFIEHSLASLYESESSYLIWRGLIRKHQVKGVQVHDARPVSVMLANGIRRILTFNTRDFARYDEIEAIHPDIYLSTT